MMKEGNCIVNHEETNILFVEDDATICKSLPPILETYGYKVRLCHNKWLIFDEK